MLILTRRAGERLFFGEGGNEIIVSVLSIRGGQVKIGVDAPDDVNILREEVKIRNEANAK